MKPPPDGVDRLAPREAWQQGYQAGKEALALAMQADADAAAAAGAPAAMVERDRRIAALEIAVRSLRGEAADRVTAIIALMQRVKRLEDGC